MTWPVPPEFFHGLARGRSPGLRFDYPGFLVETETIGTSVVKLSGGITVVMSADTDSKFSLP
jgi:hypothetical protein